MDIQDIIGYEALWNSMMKCKRGVTWKGSVTGFLSNAPVEIYKLHIDLMNGTYRERSPKFFTITRPKRRDIMSISFRDRIYQRSLNDVAIYPEMVKHFIYDNGACQTGKGTKFSRDRLKCHMQRHWRKHGQDGYILKMDIRGYYPNMRHEVAIATFRRHLPPAVHSMAARILNGFNGDIGFNPGSQIVQIAGISVLNGVDHYIKESLRVKHYVRYMDDMIVISDSKEELERVRDEIAAKLAEIGFELHDKKTRITPFKKGVMYLGFHFRVTDTSKALMVIDPERVKAEKRHLRNLAKVVDGNKLRECYESWRSHVAQGDNYKVLKKMDEYFKRIVRPLF